MGAGKLTAAAALLAACTVGAVAFDWPLENPILTGNFGEHRGDGFHSGVNLGGGEQPVFPISEGELVFVHEEGAGRASVPAGLGNFVVVHHQGGIRSLYGHLKGGSLEGLEKTVTRRTVLGMLGDSGYAAGRYLHLRVIDTEMGTVINPLLLLPPLPDKQSPVIRDVYVRSGTELLSLAEGLTLRRGEFEVLARVYDVRPDVSYLWRMSPYRIVLYQDGREQASLVFGTLHERRGGGSQWERPAGRTLAPGMVSELVLVGGEQSSRDIYEEPWLVRLGFVTLAPGESSLAVFAGDFAGNEISREFSVRVTD